MNSMSSRPLHALIVEDSEDDALLIVRELRKGGFDTSYTRVDDIEGLNKALSQCEWDVVITDYNMPSFSPAIVLETLKTEQIDIPVIMVSGSIGEDIAVDTMKAGAHDYIMKHNLTRLVPAIEREIREANNRSAYRDAQAAMHHMAFHDPLTGLLNRYEFEQRLQDLLDTPPDSGHVHNLLFLDLDQFKIVNDTCGHAAGDELLKQLSNLLLGKIRDSDTFARLGGDEFGILLRNCKASQAQRLAEGILSILRKFRFLWQDKSFAIGGSIGMVPLTPTRFDPAEAMQAADMACYTAKDLGRDRVHIYTLDDEDLSRRQDEMQWTTRLQVAIEKDHFHLYYQTIEPLSAELTQQRNAEVLLRLVEDDGSVILPGAFIPAAERYGLMPKIDRWVVSQTLRLMADIDVDVGKIFVNISGASFSDSGFCAFVENALKASPIASEKLCFEVTETAAIANLDKALEFINRVRAAGCSFALDDFGSGLSSFSYLKTLPLDYLKIDGVFARDIETDLVDRAIVESITQIGHVMGLKIIAEWVESQTILDTLREIGVDYAQGFHLTKPQSFDRLKLGSRQAI